MELEHEVQKHPQFQANVMRWIYLQHNVLEVLHVADSLLSLSVPLQPPNLLLQQFCLLSQPHSRLFTVSEQLVQASNRLPRLRQLLAEL